MQQPNSLFDIQYTHFVYTSAWLCIMYSWKWRKSDRIFRFCLSAANCLTELYNIKVRQSVYFFTVLASEICHPVIFMPILLFMAKWKLQRYFVGRHVSRRNAWNCLVSNLIALFYENINNKYAPLQNWLVMFLWFMCRLSHKAFSEHMFSALLK